MNKILLFNMFRVILCYIKAKLKGIPRLNTATALKILPTCHQESLNQKVDVDIMVMGIDGSILERSKSEKMDPDLYDFVKLKAQTSYFKGVATEELEAKMAKILKLCRLVA